MSFADSPIVQNPVPDGQTLAELLDALGRVDDAYQFERLWGQALASASSPSEREQVLLAAAARLPQVSALVGGSSGTGRLWLRQLAGEVATRGGDLPESLVNAARDIVRTVTYEAEADLDAWRASAAANRDLAEFIREAPRSVASLRELGRIMERVRGTGVLDLVDPDVVDEVIRFQRELSRGAQRPLTAVAEWMRVSRNDLLTWANTPDAHHQLPLLVRRLVRETGNSVVSSHFPAGAAVTTGGWDGMVEAADPSPYVPAGRSGWELSVEQDSQAKAESDFEARVNSVPADERREITFVEVVCRQWTKARAFESGAAAENEFRAVRAYNVDDLEEWLEQSPATTVWFWEVIGRPLDGLATITEIWQRWMDSTRPSLDSTVVLAGRRQAVEDVQAYAKAGPGVTTVGGDVRLEEIVAFFGAAWAASDGTAALDELVVVSDRGTARRVFPAAAPMVLLATSPEVVADLPPASPHRVFVAVPGGTRADITLPPVDHRVVSEYLRERGTEFYVAAEMGALARRSLLALRRRLAVQPELHRPDWALTPLPQVLRRVLLLGSWSSAVAADRDLVERFVGEPYARIEEQLRPFMAVGDAFVALVDRQWHVVSSTDAWLLVGGEITDDDLAAFVAVAVDILTDVDPRSAMPADERWRASLDGIEPSFSRYLRSSIARTLALLASVELPTGLARRTPPEVIVRSVVRQALERAGDDPSFQVWSALAEELPLLAEAAPKEVIEAVERGLASAPEVMQRMFGDQEDSLFGTRSSHTEFLWALERLAWATEHFDDAIELLAQLDELDPGGRWSNRPAASVKSILCAWHPQTTADVDQRMRALHRLRENHGRLAWDVMLSMLPNQHASQLLHHGPEFRDWKMSDPVVTNIEYWRVVDEVSGALLDDVGHDVDRWVALIGVIDNVIWERHGDLRGRLERLSETLSDESDRRRIWDALRKFLAHHREFPDATWAMPEEALGPFDPVTALFQPADPIEKHAWLFEGWVQLGEVRRRDGSQAYEEELARRRAAAVEEIYATGGLEAVLSFAAQLEFPGQIGAALAQAVAAEDIDFRLVPVLGEDSDNSATVALAFFAERFRSGGWAYLDMILERSPSPVVSARLLRSTWQPLDAAARADELGPEVAEVFWREFSYFGLGHDFEATIDVARRLREVGRAAAAVDLLALYARQDGSEEFAVAAAEALEALMETYTSDPQAPHLREYEFDLLLKLIAQHRDVVGKDRAIRLEWFFLPLLGHDPDAPNLHQALADDPAFFVEMVSLVYRRAGEADETRGEPTEIQRRAASNAFGLLHSWHRCPGVDDSGALDGERLRAWVHEARRLLEEADRLSVGDDEIGQALVAAPADDDGWPCREVRDLIEELKNDRIEAGFGRRIFNNRGVTMRSPDAGGQQEWELARQYREWAAAMRPEWRRLARVFDGLADTYEADARREDAAAERRRRGLD